MTTVVDTYKLVFRGEVLSGVTVADAKSNVGRLLKLGDAQVEQMFSGRVVTLKRGLTEAELPRYRDILGRAGLVVQAEPEQEALAFPTLTLDAAPPASDAGSMAQTAPVLSAERAESVAAPSPSSPVLMALSPAPVTPSAVVEKKSPGLSLQPIEGDEVSPATGLGQQVVDNQVTCPVCDLLQPKRVTCKRCDADMAMGRARAVPPSVPTQVREPTEARAPLYVQASWSNDVSESHSSWGDSKIIKYGGWILGFVMSRYFGLTLWIVLISIIIVWALSSGLARKGGASLRGAFAIQAGQGVWMAVGTIILHQYNADLIDLLLLLVGLSWLALKPSRGPIYLLGIYQLIALGVNVFTFLHVPAASMVQRALLIHVACRLSALGAMAAFWMRAPKRDV